MTDSNLENTVPEGAFGIGSKKTDDFTENEKLRNFGIKDIPKALYEQLKKNSGAIVLPNQITEETIKQAAKTQDKFLKPRSEEEATALRATAAGIVDIPNEIKHLSDYLQGNPYDPNELIDLKALGLEKEGDMDNAAYQVFKFGGGFLIPYAGFNKALKGIKGIKALQGIKNYDKIATGARWFTASSAADFVAIDKFDENLFNFLADIESPVVNNKFVRPIVEYLSAPERGEGADYGEAALKSFLANSLFFEAVPVAGGAAINQLCDLSNIALSVIPINLDKPTKDFSEEKAMNLGETFSAMELGYNSVPKKCDLLILGEMGISNTTSATAISCALFNSSVKKWTGLGTGISKKILKRFRIDLESL